MEIENWDVLWRLESAWECGGLAVYLLRSKTTGRTRTYVATAFDSNGHGRTWLMNN